MTGSQYFIVSMARLHARHKKEVRLIQGLNRLHEENMKQLEIIKGVMINGKS